MAKYAVVRISGKQYRVEEGKEFLTDKLADHKKLDCEVLMIVDGDKVTIGKPVIKDASIKVKVVTEMEKGEKLEIYHFKAKSRYRKHTGFRPQHTRLVVEKIS
jgi:large subunit ribosomal protein L21